MAMSSNIEQSRVRMGVVLGQIRNMDILLDVQSQKLMLMLMKWCNCYVSRFWLTRH